VTPRFLRHEAARFRGVAEDADREATKMRLLAMAADHEARAGVANEMTDPNPSEENGGLVEPTTDDGPKITLDRKIATDLKEAVMVRRRPVGHPRREWPTLHAHSVCGRGGHPEGQCGT
jgi:hypothetical protein